MLPGEVHHQVNGVSEGLNAPHSGEECQQYPGDRRDVPIESQRRVVGPLLNRHAVYQCKWGVRPESKRILATVSASWEVL